MTQYPEVLAERRGVELRGEADAERQWRAVSDISRRARDQRRVERASGVWQPRWRTLMASITAGGKYREGASPQGCE